MKFRKITTCSKLQVPKKVWLPNQNQSSISKIIVASSNTNLFSLYYQR